METKKSKSKATSGFKKNFNDVQMLTCSREIQNEHELIELMSLNASSVKVYLVFGESFRVDRSSAIYYFKKVIDAQSSESTIREYIELSKFEQSIQYTNFYRKRVIHGSKEQLQEGSQTLLGVPLLLKERRFLSNIMICIHRQISKSQEMLCEIQLDFDAEIDPMMTVTQSDNVVTKLKQLKETLSRMCAHQKWNELFKMAINANIHVNLPYVVQLSDKNFKLQREHIVTGIMACSKRSQQEIDAILGVYQIFPDRVNSLNIKNLLNNPVNVTAQLILNKFPWTNHIVQPKIDGKRQLVLINNSKVTILGESSFESFDCHNTNIDTVLECERVDDILFIFDVYMFQGDSSRSLVYSDRLLIANQVVSMIAGNKLDTVAALQHLTITPVESIHILPHTGGKQDEYLKQCFNKFNEEFYKPAAFPQNEFTTDGIIISENEAEQQQKKFKWKPSHLMTIDFYAHKLEKSLLPQGYDQAFQGYTPIGLFTHITKNDMKNTGFEFALTVTNPQPKSSYVLIPFQPVIRKNVHIYWRLDSEETVESVDGKVIEMQFLPDASSQIDQWQLHRLRTDKNPQQGQLGNYYTIAEQTFFDILNPIEFESLYTPEKISWIIKRTNNKDYQLLQEYQQTVRQMLYRYIQEFRGKGNRPTYTPNSTEQKTILDINLGIADDLLVYSQFGFQKLLCVTDMLNQVSELITTKYNAEKKNIPKPLLEILYIETDEDLKQASDTIKAQHIDCVLINIIKPPEQDRILCTVLDSIAKDSLVAVVQIDPVVLEQFNTKYESATNKIQFKVNRGKTDKDTEHVSFFNPQFGAVMDIWTTQTQHTLKFMKGRGFLELQSFTMDLRGNYSQFSKDYLAQLFQQRSKLTQQEIDFTSIFKISVFLKK